MKASVSSFSNWVMASFCIAVGVLRWSEVSRWDAIFGSRPREVKCDAPSGRGALDGERSEGSCFGCGTAAALAVGLDVKREEMISVLVFAGFARLVIDTLGF